jgi:hypothetical protein
LNKAIDGEEGGKGSKRSRIVPTASISNPAKLVVKKSGFFFPFATAINTPGRAEPAEQPQTEFTMTSVVPGLDNWSITSSEVSNSWNPLSVSSSFMGNTISSGYIFYVFLIKTT